ncbi:MAG: UPF0149 family protein [Pseudomonadota bacterium]
MELDYDTLNSGLIESRAGTRAAECHGVMSAYFIFHNELQMELLRDHLVSGLDDHIALEQAYVVLDAIGENVVNVLESEEITFKLLIPDDDESIAERATALSEWCAGFLSGLGLGGFNNERPLSSDCEEFIKDLAKIAQLETQPEEDESSEAALTELVEYVRIGVLTLQQDFDNNVNQNESSRVLH